MTARYRAPRPCDTGSPWPCDCKPGDHTCGRLRPSLTSLPVKERRRLTGKGGYRPAELQRRRYNAVQGAARRAAKRRGL